MKKIFLVIPCIFLSAFLFMGQQTEQRAEKWSIDPRTTSAFDPSTSYSAPLPYVPDYFNPNPEIQTYVTPNGVFVVNPNLRVLPKSSTPPYTAQSEVIIMRHPLNPLIMYGSSNAITSTTGTSINFISEGAYVTTNGGTTWFGSDTMKNAANAPLTGHGGDPGITVDKDGRFIITHLGGGITANYSTNNGLNWSPNLVIVGGSQDKNLTGTDDSPSSPFYGRTYTVWSRFTAALPPIAVSYTANGGVSWSAATDINVPPSGHYSQGCDIRTGPNGEVYVCWTNPISGGSFTGDFLGFAKSTTGGTSWTVNNNVYDMNGIRGTIFTGGNQIRVNDFPRIDVDRTCGPRAGWIYVVTAEINLAPAGSDADIVMHSSSNGGANWSAGVRVNQDALNNGRLQWFPVVRVDESGAVNVVYYDNRNTGTPSSAIYLSRSTDGGLTFSDIQVSDHAFTISPITLSGIAAGYAGDYIGLTSALIEGNPVNGNQRLWPLWMDNSTGIYQAWTAKVELLPTNPCTGCQDFTSTAFTPGYFHLEYTGTQYWSRQTPSAYGNGTGSAKMDFFNDNVGTSQSLVTSFQAVPSGYYLTFDEAYAPYGASFPGPDTLIVETSTNLGGSYTTQAVLLGKFPDGGELNTAPATTSSFVPTSSQWRSKIYSLPVGTNRVRLRAESGFGNNLYIDNVCIKALPTPTANFLCAMPEGFYRSTPFPQVIPDSIRTYLYRTDFPNIPVDSAIGYSSMSGCFNSTFPRAESGVYFLVFKHRNSIETWTDSNLISYNRGSGISLDIINNNTAVYGDNQKLADPNFGFYGMFSGDCNDDNIIDAADLILIYNDVLNFTGGYVISDVNGDLFTDVSDIVIAYNNAINVVERKAPFGAPSTPSPNIIENDNNPVFSSDAERQKWELAKHNMNNNGIQNPENKINKEIIESETYQTMKKVLEEKTKNVVKQPADNNSNFNGSYNGNGVMR